MTGTEKIMKQKVLEKKKLPEFLDEILKTRAVIAPVKEEDHSVYSPLKKGADVCLDFLRPMKSAKEVFFPQNEVMFYFNQRTQKMVEPPPAGETLLFGVTPCDLAGIAAQDKLFSSGEFKDSYYLRRRKQTIIAGMGCPEPGETCFCHSFGIDRFSSAVADLFFNPLEDRFVIDVNTQNGEELVKNLPEASEKELEELKKLKGEIPQFSMEPIPLEDMVKVVGEHFDSPVWDEVAMRCIGCAACTFVCPTCHCFDITDETRKDVGRRMRTWDGCMFPKFTLHASGHNPRTQAGQRMRQRVLHKFSYFNDNQGIISCTGCGRCVEVCPVNLDIRDILKRLSEYILETSDK